MTKLFLSVVALAVITSAVVVISQQKKPFHDEPKPQKITCVNNLRAIGLALREWSSDQDGNYPFNVSTNAGGTQELAKPNSEGFAANPADHLRLLGPEILKSPRVLICPKEHNKKAAPDWTSVTSENITYKLRCGTNVTENTKQILAVCPIDGNTLYTDGTVTGETEPIKPGEPQPMRVQ